MGRSDIESAVSLRPLVVSHFIFGLTADADYPAGYTELTWSGINKNGNLVSSGVYFYRISADKWSKVKKMMMVK